MACERCAAQLAGNSCTFVASVRAPNGQLIWFEIKLRGSSSPLFTTDAWFCESCYGSFMEMFAAIGEGLRLKGVQTSVKRTHD